MSSEPAGFSRPSGSMDNSKETPESRGFSSLCPTEDPALKPLWSAPATMIPAGAVVPTTPVSARHFVVEAGAAPCSAEPASHMRQDRKPALLPFIQRLVQRVRRVGDFLQRGRRTRHVVGAFAQLRHGIIGPLLVLACVHPLSGALLSQLPE